MANATIINATKNFTKISNGLIEDTRLSTGAFWLMSYLLHMKIATDDFIIKVKAIAYKTKRNENTLNKYMHELIDCGYVQRKDIYEGGRFKGYNYTVIDYGHKDENKTRL